MSDVIHATCHCGAVHLRATLSAGLDTANRCNCSFCHRRQAANVSVYADSLEVTRGADTLSLYQFGTNTAQHYFCSKCGIYTHHRRRTDPSVCGVNLGCIDGAKVWEHEPIAWSEGINHPSDQR